MEQQNRKFTQINAHICQMLGISKHGFDNLTVAEKQSFLDYYLEILEAMDLPAEQCFQHNGAVKEDFEAHFLGDIHYVRAD